MVYKLPDLDYDYGALAPHIAPEIMELHHSKHHAAYVAGANTALEKLAEARETGNFAALNKLEKDLAFHLGGHINHSVFWKNMSPDGGGEPDGELASAIDEFFGSYGGFQRHFNENANAIQGSGWSMLVWDTLGQRLNINQLFDQQGNLPVGVVAMRVDARTQSAVELDDFVASFDFPLIAHLRQTQVYVHCARDGASVFDLPRSRAEADWEQWKPLTRWIAKHAPVRGV